ncbi:O-antigen ligase family protein [Alphaproteobacteria bacterium]|nr:O-antigen ligase family protein [Alphaproteobacteria bacterium]
MKELNIVKESSQALEPTIKIMFRGIWAGLTDALAAMPHWEKGFHIFWLFGPFILLIERSPADIWLSILALAFVVRSIMKHDGGWLKTFWVRASFLFLAVCTVSSAFSVMPAYAFSEGLAWFRFPLFAMATAFWLGTDRRLLYAMLVSTALGTMLMTGILTAEMIIEGQKYGRLSWPYDDLVPGNYLAKVGLPAFTIMVALAIGAKPRLASIMGGLSLISIIMSVLTGERINFLIRACGGMLAALAWRPHWRRYIILVFVEILAVAAVFTVMPNVRDRFTNAVVNSLPTGPHSDYYRVMGAGIKTFETAPVLGIGPATHRELCPSIVAKSPEFRCANHPHNYFIQLLTETGVIGFGTGSLMIVSIIWAAFAGWRKNRDNVVAATAFVVPFGLFFPIQSTGDFFGQWNNIFMWSAIALALAAARTLTAEQKK